MHIESRPSKKDPGDYDFFVSCDDTKGGLQEAIDDLKQKTKFLQVLSRNVDQPLGDSSEC